ncbi:hypothetical protein ABT282_02575 [Streptomyces sp. NPDC000927]
MTFVLLAALSVVGALIGADLVAKLGISADTAVVGERHGGEGSGAH